MSGDRRSHTTNKEPEEEPPACCKGCRKICRRLRQWCWEECAVGEYQQYTIEGGSGQPRGQAPAAGGTKCSLFADGNTFNNSYEPDSVRHSLVQSQPRPSKGRYDGGHFQVPATPNLFLAQEFTDLKKETRIRFVDGGMYRGASVVWTGYRRNETRYENPHASALAVVRLDCDENHAAATDGVFDGHDLLPPGETRAGAPGRRYLLLRRSEFQPLERLKLGDYCVVRKGEATRILEQESGFVRKRLDDFFFTLEPIDTNFHTDVSSRWNSFADYYLSKVAPPCNEEMSQAVQPITGEHFDDFLGRNKGIQGRFNSCYLDTLLFCSFAFSSHLDDVLTAPDDGKDAQLLEVVNVLRYQIVFPLRACHFVSYYHVEHLRSLIAHRTGNPSFETETRDIPECMDALFGKMLLVPPMLSIGRVANDQPFFDGAYTTESLPMERVRFPSSKQLLEHASVKMDFCLEKMPNCFVLQLPREHNQNALMLPSYKLDLKNLIYRSVKVCHVCNSNATLQFQHLIDYVDLSSTFFCHECAESQNLDLTAAKVVPEPHMNSMVDEDTEVTISALICIERSHYNCFVRCGSEVTERWVFFDSMSDQENLPNLSSGEMESVNIPLVEEVEHFKDWLEEAPNHIESFGNLDSFFASLTPNERERASRIFYCPYNIIYRSNKS